MALDVANDVEAMEELLALGVLRPPVVKVGQRWVRAGPKLNAVAELLGIAPPERDDLAVDELYRRLSGILSGAQTYVGAIPPDKLLTTEVPRRKRNLRELSFHVFMIPLDLVEHVEDGEPFVQGTQPVPDAIQTPDDLVAFARSVRARLTTWYASKPAAYWETEITTEFGTLPMYEHFLRTTWHCGQHSRQIAALLESIGIEPAKIDAALYEGLPLPERLWE